MPKLMADAYLDGALPRTLHGLNNATKPQSRTNVLRYNVAETTSIHSLLIHYVY